MQTIELKCSAWYDERPRPLAFPDDWELEVVGGDSLSELSDEALLAAIRNPVAGEPLARQARAARSAAIIIDDITRPTPSARVLPLLVRELLGAGVPRDSITVFVAGGTHGAATSGEIEQKLGSQLHGSLRVVPHDMRTSVLRSLGHSSRGTPIAANGQMLACDLKLGIGGLYPHPVAGFSGGSKLIAPGLCSLETARFLHDNLGGDDWRGRAETNNFRRDVDEIAGRIGLSFVVNVALNFERKIAAAFAGDRLAAQREGIQFVRSVYAVPRQIAADIVVSDAYPFDTDFYFAFDRATWALASRSRDTVGVLLASCVLGAGGHALDLPLRDRILHRLQSLRLAELHRVPQRIRNLRALVARRKLSFFLVNDVLQEKDIENAHPQVEVLSAWDSSLSALRHAAGKAIGRVVLYRCAPLLVPVDTP
jgi:nickel-dependent lactate racemase